jgi:hypothetical protein
MGKKDLKKVKVSKKRAPEPVSESEEEEDF